MYERSALGICGGEGCSPQGRAVEPASDGVVAGGVPVLGREDCDCDDLAGDDSAVGDMTPCDRCGELFPDYEIAHVWIGAEDLFLCGWCQETSPDVDRQIDQMRGK
jgi:hypothetical protein